MRVSAGRVLSLVIALLFAPMIAKAHVGNKDIFVELHPGSYKLFVTVRPPLVIPGVATVDIRSSGPTVQAIHITPIPMTGEASKHPPTSDTMKRSDADASFFTGSLWLMAPGSWKVQIAVDGEQGQATASVPVSAMALTVKTMNRPLGLFLGLLGLLLAVGTAGIVAAATRESRLAPGDFPDRSRHNRALVMGGVTLAVVMVAVWAGGKWWNVEAANYASQVYRPSSLIPTVQNDHLDLKIRDSVAENTRASLSSNPVVSGQRNRSVSDLIPDHGHLMHLYAIREPGMDAVYHLHPAQVVPGELAMTLPDMPAGRYRLFADIVHRNGLPETLIATISLPDGSKGGPLNAEDASASPAPLNQGELGPADTLPDGYRMVWDKPAKLAANEPTVFRFRLMDAQGKPATDVVPYLGMAGHAAFVKDDWTAFAHTHPDGSAPMQSMMVANPDSSASTQDMAMGGMDMSMGSMDMPISPTVEFPYGFPSAGRYRIFVQMKHGHVVETGVFDADVK